MARNMIRITDQIIEQMVQDPKISAEFPFLAKPPTKRLTKVKRGCGGCGGTRRRARTVVNTNAIRRRLAELPENRAKQLKDMLGVKKIRVTYKKKIGGRKKTRDATL